MGTACPSWTRNACVAPSPRATAHTLPVPNGADTNQTGTPDNSITPTPTPIPGPTPNQLVWTYGITEAVAPEGAAQRSVTGLAIDLDGNRILVGFTDDPSTETAARALHMLDDRPFTLWSVSVGGPVTGVDISDDGSRTMAGSADRKISSYNMDEAVRWTVESSDVGGQPANVAAVSADGSRAVAGDQTSQAYLLNADGAKIWAFEADGAINDVVVATSGNRAGVGTASSSVYVLNSQGAAIRQVSHPETSIVALVISSSGSLLAARTADGRVFAFNGQGVMSWEVLLGGSVSSVGVNSSRNKIVAASRNTIYLLSVQ